MMLEEINRLAEAQKPAPSKKTESNDSKARAMDLLKQAAPICKRAESRTLKRKPRKLPK